MVLCAQMVALPDTLAQRLVLPTLAKVQERCAVTTSAEAVRQTVDTAREALRGRIAQPPAGESVTAKQLAAVAMHPDMHANREGYHRIVYQIMRGMAAYRPNGGGASKRPEQIRVPLAGLTAHEALTFWHRLSTTLLSPETPMLLLAPDPAIAPWAAGAGAEGSGAGWVDLVVGEPAAPNLFCIKAGTKPVPLTSDIPYTLEPAFTTALNNHLQTAAGAPADAPMPPWPAGL
jgi:hypothetical protein